MSTYIYARISKTGTLELKTISSENLLEATKTAAISEYGEQVNSNTQIFSQSLWRASTPEDVVDILHSWGCQISVPMCIDHIEHRSQDVGIPTNLFGRPVLSFSQVVNDLDYATSGFESNEVDFLKRVAAFVMLELNRMPEAVDMTSDDLFEKYRTASLPIVRVPNGFNSMVNKLKSIDTTTMLMSLGPINEIAYTNAMQITGVTNPDQFLADLYGSFCGTDPQVLLKACFTLVCSVSILNQCKAYTEYGEAVSMLLQFRDRLH